MNLETVLKCAQMAAAKQEAFLGRVDQDVQDLIAELTAPPAPKAAPKKAAAEPVAAPAAE
jgi:hypothetical protein